MSLTTTSNVSFVFITLGGQAAARDQGNRELAALVNLLSA